MGKDIEKWDPILTHIEFAYNQSTNQTAGCSPFEAIYGKNPISPLDLSPLLTTHHFSGDVEDRVCNIRRLHKQVQDKIHKQTDKYKRTTDKHKRHVELKKKDLMWVHI